MSLNESITAQGRSAAANDTPRADKTPEDHGHSAEQRIRQRAFDLWRQAGSPEGRSDEFWYQACKIDAEADTTVLASMNHNSITRPQND